MKELGELRARLTKTSNPELFKQLESKTEFWLDKGYGACPFRELAHRKMLHQAFTYFHLERVELGAFVIMPNHVHAIARPLGDWKLESWMGSIKQFVSHRIPSEGTLWFEESFDRIIRDVDHLQRCIRYIGRNPGRPLKEIPTHQLWLNPEWVDLGYRFSA